MELADNPKFDLPSSCEVQGLEVLDSGKISVSAQTNDFQYTTKPESFVIDVDRFPNGAGEEISQNSRIARDFSRKGLFRGGNKITHDQAADPGDSISALGGSESTAEKQAVGGGVQSHQMIAMTSGHGGERCSVRRNSFKRSPQASWYLDPRKVFLFCATLSCVGTTLLIYLAFWSGMLGVEESELDY